MQISSEGLMKNQNPVSMSHHGISIIQLFRAYPVHMGDKQYTGYTLYTLFSPLFPTEFTSSLWIDQIVVAF